ncbi:unnamed protein product [Angiostrongylus costaricensis]|uniref:Transposase n=1 Tax=Angiostrongylus costaricensis TaxID=334426 RepID=A0A0R3PVL0_ANGCS|nr:unnamed protein product [Angiostrongylus costaricensis]
MPKIVITGIDPHFFNSERPNRFAICSKVASSHLDQFDDAVPYPSCLRDKIFYRELRCKCACIVGHSPLSLAI